MGRSVYNCLNEGVAWEDLTAAQRRRWHLDRMYGRPVPRDRALVSVPRVDEPYVRVAARAKALYRSRDDLAGTRSSSVRHASLEAFRSGAISRDELKLDDKLNKLYGASKHSYCLETNDRGGGGAWSWADAEENNSDTSDHSDGNFQAYDAQVAKGVDRISGDHVVDIGIQVDFDRSGGVEEHGIRFGCFDAVPASRTLDDGSKHVSTQTSTPLPAHVAPYEGPRESVPKELSASAACFVPHEGLVAAQNETIALLRSELEAWETWALHGGLGFSGARPFPHVAGRDDGEAKLLVAVASDSSCLPAGTLDVLRKELDDVHGQIDRLVAGLPDIVDHTVSKKLAAFADGLTDCMVTTVANDMTALGNDIKNEVVRLVRSQHKLLEKRRGDVKENRSGSGGDVKENRSGSGGQSLHTCGIVPTRVQGMPNMMPMKEFIQVAADIRRRLPHVQERARPCLALYDVDPAVRLDDAVLIRAMMEVFKAEDVRDVCNLRRSALLRKMELYLGARHGSLDMIKDKISSLASVLVEGYVRVPGERVSLNEGFNSLTPRVRAGTP